MVRMTHKKPNHRTKQAEAGEVMMFGRGGELEGEGEADRVAFEVGVDLWQLTLIVLCELVNQLLAHGNKLCEICTRRKFILVE